ncbi:MAG TPA: dienelactone hydrolase family protein [Rhizomicrobium sp.]
MAAGKMIFLTMSDGKAIGVYRVQPHGVRRGGLVLIQEVFGVTGHIKAVSDSYAAEGYEVLAPSLFDREAPGFISGYSPEEMPKAAALAYGAPLDRRVADTQSCIDELKDKGPVFAVGYCYGGSVVWAAACRCTGLAAASSYYGKLVPEMADETPKCPTICHFGKTDASIPLDEVEKLRAKHPEVAVYLYDAGHGFNSERPTHYAEEAATLARERTLELFRANGG